MYEVFQNVDLSLKVDTLSLKKSKTQILNSHTQSIAKLGTQIRQLANVISRRDEGKLPSHPIENPKANYHEQAKTVTTFRNGKLLDNKVGEPIKDSELNENETEGIDNEAKIEKKTEKELVMNLRSISILIFARLTLDHMGYC
ncbi:hypothetical protein M9H77_12455 [Catharanthus roseus]|uniref:Uncharacterized protein n=1 Tax=Catharanthus roseus TaxID=4058 RepID=A0ACC0BHE6_CATRO|nr:hypothetical protein M9H77_12455 [Catharanthus roseus]